MHREEVAEAGAASAEGVRVWRVRRPRHGGSLHLLLLLDPELLELRHAEAALRDLLGLVLLRRPRHAGGGRAGAVAVPRQLVVVVAALLMHHLFASNQSN